MSNINMSPKVYKHGGAPVRKHTNWLLIRTTTTVYRVGNGDYMVLAIIVIVTITMLFPAGFELVLLLG